MGKIPVLNDTQSERLKHLLSQNKIDLTKRGGSSTRLPTMPEEPEVITAKYNGPFAVHIDHLDAEIEHKLWISCNPGDVVVNGFRDTCPGLVYTTPGTSTKAMLDGDSLWLGVYLDGRTEKYTFLAQSTAPTESDDIFYTKLAENHGGGLKQIQYGDIRFTARGVTRVRAASNRVSVTPASGVGDVSLDVNLPDSGIGYPDYVALSGKGTEIDPYVPPTTTSENEEETTEEESASETPATTYSHTGIGVTYLLPVHSGASIKYMTSYPECIDEAIFAPPFSSSGTHTFHRLREGVPWITPSAGWVRISVLDNGAHEGACLRFLVDGADWTDALPLFRFGSYDGGRFTASLGISITAGTDTSTHVIAADIEGDGTTISVTPSANPETPNKLIVSAINSGAGEVGFPDYATLSEIPEGVPSPAASVGIGTTFLLPAKANVAIKYYAPSGVDCFAKYAPSVGVTGGTAHVLSNDTSFTPTVNGWVRISVLDDGAHQGECLRLYSGSSNQWADAFPLYRFGTFQNLTGDETTIKVENGVISYIGGGGGGSGIRCPDYSKLEGEDELLYPCCTYTASEDGWVRVSTFSDGSCLAIYITNGNNQYKIGLGYGRNAMTWLIPIAANSKFYVEAPLRQTRIWFDGACTPAKHPASDDVDVYEVQVLTESALRFKNSAAAQYYSAASCIQSATSGLDRATACFTYASNGGIQASAYYTSAMGEATSDAASATMDVGDVWSGKMSNFVDSVYYCYDNVSSCGDSAAGQSSYASDYADSAHAYYTSASATNAALVTLGITGGTMYVDMASSASQEASSYCDKIADLIVSGSAISVDSAATLYNSYTVISAYADDVSDYRSYAWDKIDSKFNN
ncbi:MAG: hypothetical protein PUC15_07960 [Lentisphaeria bacterium]|nr:hypothetical protein [Lentisphaeria bacterium]